MTGHIDDIIKGCSSGKAEDQAKLYNLFAQKMYAVCLYYCKDQTEAEDLLHDGFMKVFRSIGQFKGEGSLEGWIRRIMVNTFLEKFRKHNLLYPVDDVYEYMDDIGYEDIISRITFEDLLSIIRDLPPQYRTVFNLYVMEDLPHKEIASLLGISEGTSKSNLSRARNLLQKKVSQTFGMDISNNKMVV